MGHTSQLLLLLHRNGILGKYHVYEVSHSHTRTHTHAHTGGRTSAEIVNWLMKKTGPPAVELTDAEAAQKFSDKDEVVLIGFFKDVETNEAKAFIAIAETQDSLAFGITSSQEVADAMEATFDSIILYKKVRAGEGEKHRVLLRLI